MNTLIKAALVVPKKQIPVDSVQLADQKHILLSIFSSIEELQNSDYFDVLIVDESCIPEVRNMPKQPVSLIVLAKENTHISELLPRISDISYYTVLQYPVTADTLIKQARAAFDTARSKKLSQVEHTSQGKTIAVTSFANGAGKTLISYNLAHKLALFLPENSVSLTDMNTPLSNAKAMINLEESYSWNTIRPILKEGEVSATKLGNIVYPTPYRFQLLGGATSYAENKMLSDKEFTNLVLSLNNLYSVNIVDSSTVGSSEDVKRLSSADSILIVLDGTGISILQTKRGLEMMQQSYPELIEKVKFVINRIDVHQGKTAELIASRFGIEVFAAIDDDPDAVRVHQDAGKLFTDKTLLIDTQLYQLAEKLVRVVL